MKIPSLCGKWKVTGCNVQKDKPNEDVNICKPNKNDINYVTFKQNGVFVKGNLEGDNTFSKQRIGILEYNGNYWLLKLTDNNTNGLSTLYVKNNRLLEGTFVQSNAPGQFPVVSTLKYEKI